MALALERAWRSLATKLCFRSPTRNAPGGHATPTAVADEETEEEDCESPVSTWRLSRSGSRSSTNVCAICLGGMRAGKAVFTAECCHKFHFHCISSNVEQGSHVCPICRAVWMEIPLQANAAHGTTKINPLGWPQQERRLISRVNRQYGTLPVFHESQPELGTGRTRPKDTAVGYVEIMVYTEVPAIQKSVTRETFDILIHLKATAATPASWPRAAIDLVAVLDLSGGMAGTKLVLFTRAISFVIQSLGPNNRLCVLTSQHSACRLFPFRKMTASGQQQSLQDIAGCLSTADGGSDIGEALRKAGRATEDRQERNPACGIILLSGSQDNHGGSWRHRDYCYSDSVLGSVRPGSGHHVRIHAFGLVVDHRPKVMAMRAVAEASGGTFSFIGDVGSITDEFARCIGDLRGVVARETCLSIRCVQQGVLLTSIRSGGCASTVDDERRCGSVDVGDLYAGEERDFLVTVHVPAVLGGQDDSALIMPSCTYRRPAATVTMDTELVQVESNPVVVRRPTHLVSSSSVTSLEVERERQRLYAVKDIAAARDAAEQGKFARAVSILEGRRRKVESRAMLWADARTLAFVAELREMEDRVATRRRYEETGRAYILAGLSAHSWQRGADSTDDLTCLTHSYQAPCMLDMSSRSQRLLPEAVEEMNHLPVPGIDSTYFAGP
ncbi:uncharacterized protein LOC100840742 [Brachypodium distachyon]|uniref:RING-type domain-containing protein n=1 Tax=Brachypodium distachyon TaxID=15368 RepID=I1I4I1_BRADI|nr:uncharacterized protein LOC100840742 [Brachypodium distachyon]KQJ96991.1 hypothetical protein BRADI_3g28160v3 [Brachypodium distachyon]|eukprot:XP_014755996.1 uncharacterized protein LOC100840742 [Brachypodium distachyon]